MRRSGNKAYQWHALDNQAESLQIAWYGGEPLLAIETVEKITRGIRSDEILFNASMVTNGYFLDGKTAELLAKMGSRTFR